MATKKLKPVHPGAILRHDFLAPLSMTPYRLAKELGVSAPTVNDIARERRAVSAEMALRLARYWGTTAEFWLNVQARYDLEAAQDRAGRMIERTIRPAASAARENGAR